MNRTEVKEWCLQEVKARGRKSEIGQGINVLKPSAWPGMYPLTYYDQEGNILCAKCATKDVLDYLTERDEWLHDLEGYYEPTFPIQGYDAHYEGPPEYCDGCSTAILSAYGDPDETEETCEVCGALYRPISEPHTDADCNERLDLHDRSNLNNTESGFWYRMLSKVMPGGRARNWTVNV